MARFFLNEEFQSVDMNARFSRRPMEVADIKLLASTAFGGVRSPRKGAAPVSWDPLQIIAERIDSKCPRWSSMLDGTPFLEIV